VRILVALLAGLAVAMVAMFAFGWWQFSRIDRVEVSEVLAPAAGGGTNYLIVGSDTREGIAEDDPNAGAFLDEGVSGSRTDSIMVLRVGGGESALLSIPRDLWVTNPATGEVGRINSVYQSGPTALIQAVQGLGIPIQHYLEIDFVSFAGLVDAIGGIDVEFATPARDTHSGLDVPEAGVATLDGSQALAYVRSRYYEQLVDGGWQTDPTADLGRVQRQRAFLSSLMGKVAGSRNPFTLGQMSTALAPGMKIDDAMTYFDAIGLGWDLRGGFNPESLTLPVTPRTTSGGAAVLELDDAQMAPILARFGG
jgi:LCP family protein required for cell wall assembly